MTWEQTKPFNIRKYEYINITLLNRHLNPDYATIISCNSCDIRISFAIDGWHLSNNLFRENSLFNKYYTISVRKDIWDFIADYFNFMEY